MSSPQQPSGAPLPDFLVIGAMKCGTTTLYHDLKAHPGIFLPDKEANFLCGDDAAERYAAALRAARPGQIRGDVSPDYAKLPESASVAPRARCLFSGDDLKLLYIVRDPLSRTLSHHAFVSTQGAEDRVPMGPDLNQSLRDFPCLIDYSRYAMQVRPWLEAFGRDHLLVIRFEDYIRRRKETMRQVFSFLGVEESLATIDEAAIYNSTKSRPVLTTFWKRIIQTGLYRQGLRRLVPPPLRERFRNLLLPKPDDLPSPPDPEAVNYIVSRLKEDVAQFSILLGLPEPLWDLDEAAKSVREKPLS